MYLYPAAFWRNKRWWAKACTKQLNWTELNSVQFSSVQLCCFVHALTSTVSRYCWRLSGSGSWQYTALYYRCNRLLVDALNGAGPVLRPLSLPKRHIHFKAICRNVAPRPDDVSDDRRRLQKLPIFLYNSAPEADVLTELKDTVDSTAFVFLSSNECSQSKICKKKLALKLA